MALFRKFFLKKTPDRLLEISERVYGIMLATLVRAGVSFAGMLHVLRSILRSRLVLGVWNFREVFFHIY
jgi:hypothetical protein